MKRQRGFTLIEILIATAAFLILLGAVMGLFTFFARAQRAAAAVGTVVGEAQNILDVLERELRTAYGSTFTNPGGPSSFRFQNQNAQEVTYRLDTARTRAVREVTGQAAEFLTADQVHVRALNFSVTAPTVDRGTGPQLPLLTGRQGRVTVGIHLCPRGIDDQRCLVLQTTLTSRQYAPR